MCVKSWKMCTFLGQMNFSSMLKSGMYLSQHSTVCFAFTWKNLKLWNNTYRISNHALHNAITVMNKEWYVFLICTGMYWTGWCIDKAVVKRCLFPVLAILTYIFWFSWILPGICWHSTSVRPCLLQIYSDL